MNGTLRLERDESSGMMLLEALKLLIRKSEIQYLTDKRRVHVAMGCKSYSFFGSDQIEHINATMTDDFILKVIIPEICDNMAREYMRDVLMFFIKHVWESEHPKHELPDDVKLTLQSLYADESQTSSESQKKAREIEAEWSEYTGEYNGQYNHIIELIESIYDDRLKYDYRKKPVEFAKSKSN